MKFILNKILQEQNLSAFSKLKSQFFEAPYSIIYRQINLFYEKYAKIPSFEELEIVIRDDSTLSLVQNLKEVEVPDELDTDVLIQALINEYAQKETLHAIDKMVDEIMFMDAASMVENLSSMAIDLEDKTESSEQIVSMADYKTYDKEELASFCPLGLNNDFDAFSIGLAPTEFIMFGGFVGAGKSIVCANITANQYNQGNSSLYFSIEMRGREIFQRHLSILSGVSSTRLKANTLTIDELDAVARTRVDMHADADYLLEEYKKHKDFDKFESDLLQLPLRTDKQIVMIDNQHLSIANIDATIQTYKARFKDKLKVVVVDYLNVIDCKDPFDWKSQIEIARRLKGLARKHKIVMVAPFQIDEKGGVRFAKGILDAPDWAFNLTAKDNSILFESKKSRGSAAMDFESEMDWDALRILPYRNILQEETEETEETDYEESPPWESGEDDL